MGLKSDFVIYWLYNLGVALDPLGPQYSLLTNGDKMIHLLELLYPED